MRKCSICNAAIEEENPSILTMGGYGNPRFVCKECDAVLEKMLRAKEPETVREAMQAVSDHLLSIGCEDGAAISVLEKMMQDAAARAEAIKEGTYDFSMDEQESEELLEIPEELRETEEDRALDEKEEQIEKRWDQVMNRIWYVMLGLCGAVALYIIIKLFI